MSYIKFSEKDKAKGFLFLAVRMPLVGYRGEILKVPDFILPELEQKGFQFEKVGPPNPDSNGRLKE